MIKILWYYFEDGNLMRFNKYTIDQTGVIRNKKTDKILICSKSGKYNVCAVQSDDGKRRMIRIGRALASTFVGPPPTTRHTVDHIDRDRNNDTLDNIRWSCEKGQRDNQVRPEIYKSAFIVARDGVEKTAKEWFVHLKEQRNSYNRIYTVDMITQYAQKKQHGFAYKEYPNLEGEIWKKIPGVDNWRNRWEISNMNRVKYITKYTENVLFEGRLGLSGNGYPSVKIGNKNYSCHVLTFMAFFPEEYASRKPDEIILHQDDDRMDFRPHKLRLGTQRENVKDAHDNGCYDDTKTTRMRCASYINGILEKEYISQDDAQEYLKSIGFDKAFDGNICKALNGKYKTAYGRTWQKC
jgi:hypothetical protein